MIRKLHLFLSLSLLTICYSTSFGQGDINDRLIQNLQEKKFKKVQKMFVKSSRHQVSAKQLRDVWTGIETQNGPLQDYGVATSKSEGAITTYNTPLQFEKAELILKISVNESNKVVGFFFDFHQYSPPPWALNKGFGKEAIIVETDTFKLHGELMTPVSGFPCPLVVLVHGSGPGNRNSSMHGSPNQLFQDLAYGLALKGIASIRYDKRTLVYPHSYKDSVNLYNEVIEDAISGVKLATTYDFIDSSKIYVLGHSLGGYAAPAIGESSQAAGVIMLAAPSRKLHHILPEQYEYIFMEDSVLSDEEKQFVDDVKEEVNFLDGKPSQVNELNRIGNRLMVPYFRTLNQYNPIEIINRYEKPTLILQGERDYQVSFVKDYLNFDRYVGHEPYVTLNSYPMLDHLFMPGEGPSYPSDYRKPNHIELQVVEDIATWISNQ